MAATLQKVQLSDDLAVYANPGADLETRFIYQEIFQDKCYDIGPLPQDAFLIDAGANIGFFTLYMKKKYPSSEIIAFEPAPATFETLKRNLALHGLTGVHLHRCALGRDDSSMALTYYPNMPGNSTLYVAEKDAFVQTAERRHLVSKLFGEKHTVPVDVRRLSGFLHQVPGLKRIDLLKIDVEGAELDVLHGLDDGHWALTENIVLEICDNHGRVAVAEKLLRTKGFLRVTKERCAWAPENLPMYMMTATRSTPANGL